MKQGKWGSALFCYLLVIGVFTSVTFWGNRAITAIAEKIPLERSHTIVIDAGHGGEDGGATSCSGKLESNFNLEIALKLNDLMQLMGYDTKMIRTTDHSVYTQGDTIAAKKVSDLKQRVKIVNETENALLVSIHQNTFPQSQYHGAQVFYGPKGESSHLAESLQMSFVETINHGSNRKSKKADGIYLMQHINCTGILVECGFLSNPEEEAKLSTDDYQQKICCVIGASLAEFLTK